PDAEGERDDRADGRDAERDQDAEPERQEEEQALGHEEERPPAGPVDEDAGDRGEGEDRQIAREGDEAERERRVREPVDEPALADALHPEADEREALADDEEPEVA